MTPSKPQPRRRAARRPVDRTPLITCRAVIRLDSTHIRKRAMTALQRARTAYSKAEEEWTRFHDQEAPAFSRWLQAACGSAWSRIREVQEKLEYQDLLLHLIEREHALTGADPRTCYERAKDQLEQPEKYHGQMDDEESEAGDWEPIDEDDFDGPEWDDPPGVYPIDGEGSVDDPSRVKSIYRELSRRLHPDANGSMSEQELQIWYQVQEAYQARDLDRLELLRTHADLAEGQISRHTPIGRLVEATRQIRHALKTLRRTIRAAHYEPGWGFLSWDDSQKTRIRRRFSIELQQQAEDLEDQLACLEREVESWRDPPPEELTDIESMLLEHFLGVSPSRPRRRTRDPHRNQADFDFF